MGHLSASNILQGYSTGIFPMADSRNSSELCWVKPKNRGIMPIGGLHISKSLKKFIRNNELDMTINKCFSEVVDLCANRSDTWINKELHSIYLELHKLKHAVSVEIWSKKQLIGGLFGVCIGSCFCGESMFTVSKNGSKVAMIVTMALLQYNGYTLFDTQFMTQHLRIMGGHEISQLEYETKLAKATSQKCQFLNVPNNYSWSEIIQLNNHKLYR